MRSTSIVTLILIVEATVMRLLIVSLALLCTSFVAAPAEAETYRWCAQVGSGVSPTCYFATFDKCRTYIMTAGGVCFSRVLVDEVATTASRTMNATSTSRTSRQ